MKKQSLKNMLATIAALFIAIIALPTTAQAQMQTMKILGKAYNQDAVVNIGGGTAKWDKANATLTLDGINVESYKGSFIYCKNIPNLKIVLAGNNTVNCTSYILYFEKGNVEISGTGSLTARTTGQSAIKQNETSPCTLTIKDCMLDVQGDSYSIVGYLNGPNTAALSLVVDNATLKVKGATGGWGWKLPGIYGLKAYELRGCHIETPGVRFGEESKDYGYQLLGEDNDTYYGEVSIVPGDATAISQPAASAEATVSAVYSLDGSRQPRMQQGVNIVKMSDGTTRKVIRR